MTQVIAVALAKEFEAAVDFYNRVGAQGSGSGGKVTAGVRFVSPAAVPCSGPLTFLALAPPPQQSGSSDDSGTCRFTASLQAQVLARVPPPPSIVSGYHVTLGLVPVLVTTSGNAGGNAGGTQPSVGGAPSVLPLPWPTVDVDLAVAVAQGSSSSVSPAPEQYVKQFPATTARTAAQRSFAPLPIAVHSAMSGVSVHVVARRGWLEGYRQQSQQQGTVVLALLWFAAAPTVDGASFAWVHQMMEKRRAAAATAAAAAASTVASATSASAAVAGAAAATSKPLCPQDLQCAKLANALHVRMYLHTCREVQPCPRLSREPKHGQDFVHAAPRLDGSDAADEAAAAEEALRVQAEVDAARLADSSKRVWFDATDPWVIRPRRRANGAAVNRGGDSATRVPREGSTKTAKTSSVGPSQAATRATLFTSDDEDDDGAATQGRSSVGGESLQRTTTAATDDHIAVTEVRVSLRCPLSFAIMRHPVKGRRCTHDQCFDLTSHLVSAARRNAWNCPVCDQAAYPLDLVASPPLEEALSQLNDALVAQGVDAVLITPPSSWKFVVPSADDLEDDSFSDDEDSSRAAQRQQPRPVVELSVSQQGSAASL